MPNEVTFGFGVHNGNPRTSIVTVLDDLQVEGTESLTLSGNVARTTLSASFVGDPVTVDILDDDSKFAIACSHRIWGAIYYSTTMDKLAIHVLYIMRMLVMVKNTY